MSLDVQQRLQRRWVESLFDMADPPGYIGGVPYLLLMRWSIPVVVLVRLWADPPRGRISEQVAAAIVMTVTAFLATLVTNRQSTLRTASLFQRILVVVDIALISWVYVTTQKPESMFFLFYLVPLCAAAEYLGARENGVVIGGVVLAFTMVLLPMYSSNLPHPDHKVLWVKVYGARMVFFIIAGGTAAALIRRARFQQILLRRRASYVTALVGFDSAAADRFSLDAVFADTLEFAIKHTGALEGGIWVVEQGSLSPRFTTTGCVYLNSESVKGVINRIWREKRTQGNDSGAHAIELNLYGNGDQTDRTLSLVSLDSVYWNSVLVLIYRRRDPLQRDAVGFLEALGRQTASIVSRIRIFDNLSTIGRETATAFQRDLKIDFALHQLTGPLKFRFALISLVEDGRIRAVRAHNVPPAWLRMSDHDLESDDIDAHVVRTRETIVISGLDKRFSCSLYDRFDHENLTRIFTPIVHKNQVVGVLEAGCLKEKAGEVFVAGIEDQVKQVAAGLGSGFEARVSDLLASIADHAMEILRAHSASLHLFDGAKQFRVAGAGRATEDFLRTFSPRKGGLGERAIVENRPLKVDDPSALAEFHRPLYELGVRSIAAFPLAFIGPHSGVLYVHFWQEHRYTEAELRLGSIFARQIEIALQNDILLKARRREADRLWGLAELQNVMQSVEPSTEIHSVLQHLATSILNTVDADCVALYQFRNDVEQFDTPPIMAGDFLEPAPMLETVQPSALVWRFIRSDQPFFWSDIQTHSDFEKSPHRFYVRERIRSMAAIPLRSIWPTEPVGLLFVNYRNEKEFNSYEQRLLAAIATSAAIAISNARLYHSTLKALRRRQSEIEALDRIERAIASSVQGITRQEAIKIFFDEAVQTTGATVGAIMWYDANQHLLESVASCALPGYMVQRVGEGIVGLAAEQRRAQLVFDVGDSQWSPWYKPVIASTKSELAVPLLDGGKLLGVINLEHPEKNKFDDHDKQWIETLTVHLVVFLHSLELDARSLDEAKYRIALAMIARRIHSVHYNLDLALRALLTGITAGSGLGFSRAMLFLSDEKHEELRGCLAIGAQTAAEAERVWAREINLDSGDTEKRLGQVLARAEEFGRLVAYNPHQDCELSKLVKQVRVRVEFSGALGLSLMTQETITRSFDQDDPIRDIISHVGLGDRGTSLICVPLATSEHIGALLVDNRFLPTERDIDQAKLSSLQAFAQLMAIYVENSRLRTRTQTRSYQVLIHQVKSPANTAYHLVNKVLEGPTCDVTAKGILLQARSEVGKVIGRMRNLQFYSDLANGLPLVPRIEPVSSDGLFQILQIGAWQAKLANDSKGLTFFVDTLSFEALRDKPLAFDKDLFEQAYQNLLDNAGRYGSRDSVVRIFCKYVTDTCWSVAVTNKGLRLHASEVHLCASAEWRSESAQLTSSGTGIGLYVVDQCLKAHGGALEILPTDDSGTTEFALQLPLAARTVP